MQIKFDKNQENIETFLPLFYKCLGRSRFTARVLTEKNEVKINNIRLRESKPYCGSHAGACQVTTFTEKKKKGNFLEGGDWVALDDMLNDILDILNLSASISSPVCVIRQGKERRIDYLSGSGEGEWDKYGTFENWCGRGAPRSTFTYGTPGIAEWRNT